MDLNFLKKTFFSLLFVLAGSLVNATVAVGDPHGQMLVFDSDGTLKQLEFMQMPLLAEDTFSGFTVTDAATGKSEQVKGEVFYEDDAIFFVGSADELGVNFTARLVQIDAAATEIFVEVSDPTLADRALTVTFSAALAKSDWKFGNSWGGRTLQENTYSGRGYSQFDGVGQHSVSILPLAAVSDNDCGVAIANSMLDPRLIKYHFNVDGNGVSRLYADVLLGLAAETSRFPGKANFTLVLYSFEPDEGFRSAVARYYELFPECFVHNSKYEGAWALWISELDAAKECGIGYNQCEFEYLKPDNFAKSEKAGLFNSQYSEPWGYWMPLPTGWGKEHLSPEKTTYSLNHPLITADYKALLEKDLGDEEEADRFPGITRDFAARALANTVIWRNPDGEWSFNCNYGFQWGKRGAEGCEGIIVLADSNPEIPSPNRWDVQMNQIRYAEKMAAEAGSRIHVVYLDSLVYMLGWNEFSFRRDLWQYTDVPLTWAMVDGKAVPASHQALNNAMFLRKHWDFCKENGYLSMGNSWSPVVQFCIPWLDILGAGEHSSRESLPPLADFATMRLLCKDKPISTMDYVLSFADVSGELVESRLNYLMIYGVYSGTANAWNNPDVIAKFAPAMKKYAPILKAVNEAGYQVETKVAVSGKRSNQILLERWGTSPATGLYLTCRNTSKQPAEVVLTFKESDFLNLSSNIQHTPNQAMMEEAARKKISQVSELVDGNNVVMEKNGEITTLRFTLPAERTQVINLQ